ncbi:hypothetical protein [Mangrovitalea sediminis]|uniref:hypothetical protein n=1 Tax=Mangrovitalea sediminis TaxID=1982043 RepID=UPI000BE5A655|nr:hypothetical protein [Mangrovitalea sediminis]
MFEEAWIFAASARRQSEPPARSVQGRIQHCEADCPLYYWSCEGRIRGKGSLLFLYIEYRDASGAARYTRMQFRDSASLHVFIQSHLPYWPLPGLDADQTRTRPLGRATDEQRATAA